MNRYHNITHPLQAQENGTKYGYSYLLVICLAHTLQCYNTTPMLTVYREPTLMLLLRINAYLPILSLIGLCYLKVVNFSDKKQESDQGK